MSDDIRARKEAIASARELLSIKEAELDRAVKILGNTKSTHKGYKDMVNAANALNAEVSKAQTSIQEMANDVQDVESGIEDANKKLDGFSSKVQDLISKVPIVGDSLAGGVQTATDKAKVMMDKWLKETDSGWRKTFKVLGAITAGLLLGGLFAAWKLFSSLLGKSKETMMEMSTAANDTARTLQMSVKDVQAIAGGIGSWVQYGQGWASAVAAIRDDMGFIPKLTAQENQLVAKLATNAGLGADQIANMYRHSQNLNMSLDTYVKEQQKKIIQLNQENGTYFTQAEIIKDIAGASDETLAMFGKQNQELEKQVLIGKKIGLNLNQQASMAKSLLDIESSIEAEMEARVLTGKELNLDKARELALEGDVAGAAAEVMDQVGGINEFNKMNIIQKEALAKAAGMEVGQLQKSLEMQAGLADQAQVGGAGGGGGGVAGAAGNVDMQTADDARRRKWGGVLMDIAKPLKDLRYAIEDKLYTWLTGPDGSKFITGVGNAIGEVANWIATGTAPSWWTKFESEYVTPIRDKIATFANWVKENPWTAIATGIAGSVAIKGIGQAFGLIADKSRDGSSKSNALWVRQTDGVFGDMMNWFGGKGGGFKKFSTAFRKGGFKGLGKSLFRSSGLKGITSKLSSIGKGLGGMLKGKGGGGLFKSIGKGLGSIWGGIKKGASKAWTGVKSAGSKIIKAVNPIPKIKKAFTGNAGKWIKKALGGVGKVGGKAVKGGLIGALFNAGQLYSILRGDGTPMEKAKGVIQVGGGILGGALGSIAGSIVPGIGTLAGGFVGGLLGDMIGSIPAVQNALAPPLAKALGGEEVSDFILSDRGLIKFRKDDLVIGGTKLNEALGTGDNKRLDEVCELLKQLIEVTKVDRVMSVDGNELRTALEATEPYRGTS